MLAGGVCERTELLRRVFADDVLRCPCGGRRSVVAIVVVPAIARAVLVDDVTRSPSAFVLGGGSKRWGR